MNSEFLLVFFFTVAASAQNNDSVFLSYQNIAPDSVNVAVKSVHVLRSVPKYVFVENNSSH